MENYELIGTIGEGTYGVVFKCQHKRSGRVVAVKRFKEGNGNEYIRCTMLRELRVQQLLKGEPHVVQLLEAFQEKGTLFLVMENVPCNLLDVLDRQPSGLTVDALRVLIFTLLLGLRSCHSNGIVHRDVKPENILIKDDGSATLCDFGFSRPITITQSSRSTSPALQRWSKPRASGKAGAESESDDSDVPRSTSRRGHPMPTLDELVLTQHQDCMTDYVATRWYRSPEMLLGMQQYDFAVDAWAVGAIMAEAADGQPLLPGNTEIEQLSLIQTRIGPFPKQYQSLVRKRCGGVLPAQLRVSKNKNPLRPTTSSSRRHSSYLRDRFGDRLGNDGVDLLERLLSPGAKHRASVGEALAHPFFTGLAERFVSPVSREVSSYTYQQSSDTQAETDDTGLKDWDATGVPPLRKLASTTSAPASPSSSSSLLTPTRAQTDFPPDESPNPRIEATMAAYSAVARRSPQHTAAKDAASCGGQYNSAHSSLCGHPPPERKTASPTRPRFRRMSLTTEDHDACREAVPVTPDEHALDNVRQRSTFNRFLSDTTMTRPREGNADKRTPTAQLAQPAPVRGSQRFNASTNSPSRASEEDDAMRLTHSVMDLAHTAGLEVSQTRDAGESHRLSRYASASRVRQPGRTDSLPHSTWASRREVPATNKKTDRSGKGKEPRQRLATAAPPGDGPPLVPRESSTNNNNSSVVSATTSKPRGQKRVSTTNSSGATGAVSTSRGSHQPVSGRGTRTGGSSTGRYASPNVRRTTMKATRPSHEEKPRLLREIESLTCAMAPVESLESLLPIPSPTTSARRAHAVQASQGTRTTSPPKDSARRLAASATERRRGSGGTDQNRAPVTPISCDSAEDAPVDRRHSSKADSDEHAGYMLSLPSTRAAQRSHLTTPSEDTLDSTGGGHRSVLRSTDSLRGLGASGGSSVNLPLPIVSHVGSPSHAPSRCEVASSAASHGLDTGGGGSIAGTSANGSVRAGRASSMQGGMGYPMVLRARRPSPLNTQRISEAVAPLGSAGLATSALPDADIGTGADGGPMRAHSPTHLPRRPQPVLRRPPPLAQPPSQRHSLSAMDAPTLSPVALASVLCVGESDDDNEDGGGVIAEHPILPALTQSHGSSPARSPDARHHRASSAVLDDAVLLTRSRTNTPRTEPTALNLSANDANGAAPLHILEPNTSKRLRSLQPVAMTRPSDPFPRASPMLSHGSNSVVSPVAGVTMNSVVRFQQQQLSGSRKKTRLALTTPANTPEAPPQ